MTFIADSHDSGERVLNIADLVREIHIARARMSRENPHRALLGKCEAALTQISIMLHESKTPTEAA